MFEQVLNDSLTLKVLNVGPQNDTGQRTQGGPMTPSDSTV